MAYIPKGLRSVLTDIVTWTGRRGVANTMTSILSRLPGINGQHTNRNTTLALPYYTELWNLFLTPYIFRGILFRDISRLWTGAAPILDQTTGKEIARGQIMNPRGETTEQLDLLQWNIDEFLERDMKQVLEQVSAAKLIFGKAVQEIVWERQTEGEHKGKVLIRDLKDVDPTLFQINPKGYEPGLYLQKATSGNVNATFERVDERRFWIVTNHQFFDDQNGISELEALRKAEPRRAQAETDWGRGAQRSGQGHIIGKYAKRLRGAAAKGDRDEFLEALREMSSDTVTAMDEENQVEVLQPSVQNEVFTGLIDELKMQISLVLTGSPTTLKEGKFGNQSMAESTTVRQESNLEIADASDISGSFTQQVITRFCDFNWVQTDPYPFMQIIDPLWVTPTTPEEQKNQDEIEVSSGENPDEKPNEKETVEIKEEEEEETPIVKNSVVKFQEEEPTPDSEKENVPPVAVPASFGDFPDTDPEPEIYFDLIEEATRELEAIQTKPYSEVTADEAPNTFTIKRLRSFAQIGDILVDLKNAIIPTLAAKTEEDAWRQYYADAINIFKSYGIDMDLGIRHDLILSFRQARQNAFGRAILKAGQSNPDVIGFRLETRGDDRVRTEHKFWNDVVLSKNNPLLARLRTPMDFGCRCNWLPVYQVEASQYPITPENKIPRVMPGDSYKYYAPQGGQE